MDSANLTPQEYGQMLAEEKNNRTEEGLAAEEAQSRFLVE